MTIEPTYFEELMKLGVPESLPKDGFHFLDLFDEFAAAHQKTWKQDRRLTVGASEAFGCIRKSYFGKRGHEFGWKKDETYKESYGATKRGDLIENYWVVPAIEEGLARRGMSLIMAGDGQDTIIDGVSSATLDGLIIDAPRDLLAAHGVEDMLTDCCVLEMKSFDPRINIVEEKGIHRGQTMMQMGLIRETTEYKPEFAVIIYVNASWLDDIRIFVVQYDHDTYLAGRERAEMVYGTDDPALLPAEGKLDGMCAYCPYTQACAIVNVGRVPEKRGALKKNEVAEQDQDLLAELDVAVRAQQTLKAQEKRLKREIEEANETVRQALIRRNKSRAVGLGWKVSYTTIAGRKTLSKDKLEEAGLDPEQFMDEGAGYEKLTITTEWETE
jgi:hypothetical protein